MKNVSCNYDEKYKVVNRTIELENYKSKDIDKIFFSNTKYTSCSFSHIHFENINFCNIIFEDCTFEFCSFYHCNINNKSLLQFFSSEISKCSFSRCNFKGILIKKSRFKYVFFKNTYLKGCNFINNCYSKVSFIDDCNLMDCVIKDNNCRFDICFINKYSYTKFNLNSYVGKFKYQHKYYCKGHKCYDDEKRYKDICNSYLNFESQYLKNGIKEKQGECFYESKKAFYRTLKGRKKITGFLSYYVSGYGEKPYRTFGFSLIIILFCAILYMFTGLQGEDKLILYGVNSNFKEVKTLIRDFTYCFHFSLVTFSTVGYGDLVPYGIMSTIISSIEIILGVLMVGIWTSTLVRKMTR
ncbi:MAG: pentapeptide repeat-containing protein [Clostridium argentinense]|uniref:Pentapeptide repeat-containing protein n=1 Tax=Clostridium faecium TaxID=2762223 RepID=A0ABR8YVN0_9CLOT|nr:MULTISPECIES: ion channel [Clostridium]MBD8048053.1 pentapeptide repeat-containing protein [Clostridium faecium]MBS5822288.1 pentapeptide repeat-containing protein [Clostridium argentinense]MDU1348535.1 ion channel [Clostridium argentinense]